MNEAELAVLPQLSELLYQTKYSLSLEENMPSRDADSSDDYIKRMRARTKKQWFELNWRISSLREANET